MSYLLGRTGCCIARNGLDGSLNPSDPLSRSHYSTFCARNGPVPVTQESVAI